MTSLDLERSTGSQPYPYTSVVQDTQAKSGMVVLCAGCERPILDRFLLTVLERAWHAHCVQCADCQAPLTDKCFSRDGRLFCRQDFYRRYGTKCGGCSEGISPNDLVRRAKDKVFHLKCFTCMVCRKQLSTGEELYVLDENKFICKTDYLQTKFQGSEPDAEEGDVDHPPLEDSFSEKDALSFHEEEESHDSIGKVSSPLSLQGPPMSPFSNTGVPVANSDILSDIKQEKEDVDFDSGLSSPTQTGNADVKSEDKGDDAGKEGSEKEGEGGKGAGAKRRGPRTTIKAKQLETLKNAFAATPKPTRHIREQLAQETGLSMRVIQVWFQNRRSKERRMKQLSAMGARRGQFFRHPGRRLRALRPGEEMEGYPMPFGYFPENGDFYPMGYPGNGGFGDFYPSQPHSDSMTFLPPTSQCNPLLDPSSLGVGGENGYLGQVPPDLRGMSLPPCSSPDTSLGPPASDGSDPPVYSSSSNSIMAPSFNHSLMSHSRLGGPPPPDIPVETW